MWNKFKDFMWDHGTAIMIGGAFMLMFTLMVVIISVSGVTSDRPTWARDWRSGDSVEVNGCRGVYVESNNPRWIAVEYRDSMGVMQTYSRHVNYIYSHTNISNNRNIKD